MQTGSDSSSSARGVDVGSPHTAREGLDFRSRFLQQRNAWMPHQIHGCWDGIGQFFIEWRVARFPSTPGSSRGPLW